MSKSHLQLNIEKKLEGINWKIKDLSERIAISERKLKLLLNKELISVSDPLLKLIANILQCEVNDFFTSNEVLIDNSKSDIISNKLLSSFASIDIELFFESVAKVDELIETEGKILASRERAKAYLAFYELADRLLDIS